MLSNAVAVPRMKARMDASLYGRCFLAHRQANIKLYTPSLRAVPKDHVATLVQLGKLSCTERNGDFQFCPSCVFENGKAMSI
jgi:hypothetical protein